MKKVVCSMLLCMTMIFGISSVKADNTANQIKFKYKYNRSITNACYYVDGSVSVLTSYINGAAYDWASKSNPLNMTAVSSNYATHMDFYGKPDSYWGNDGTVGETLHYLNGGAYIYPNNGDWFYVDIYLNLERAYNIQGTTAHEIGHALGLAHWNGNPYSIMAQSGYRLIHTVQTIDNQHLNEIYS